MRCVYCKQDKMEEDFGYKTISKKVEALYKTCSGCRDGLKAPESKLKAYKDRVKRSYGLSLSQLQGLLDNQKGVCKICGEDFGSIKHHIDHCHTTGEVRGLLCPSCNTGLGLFKDDVQLLKNAIRYLTDGKMV